MSIPPAPLRILFVASEAVPYVKTGGLADVAAALPLELSRLGHEVRLVLPGYGSIDRQRYDLRPWEVVQVPGAKTARETVIEVGELSNRGSSDRPPPLFLINQDAYFSRDGLYHEGGRDYPDNLQRFSFFSRGILELMRVWEKQDGWTPDILHANDWQTALCPVYLRTLYGDTVPQSISTLFTIHNLGYQGIFPAGEFVHTGLPASEFSSAKLEFWGRVNLVKGALVYADFLSTVSPTYSKEIQTPEFGFGLEGVIRERRDRLVGITNGISQQTWDPATDAHLPVPYSGNDLSGKLRCKAALQQEMNLPVRQVPLLVIVSRLDHQKGLDLVAELLPQLMVLDLQLIVLGMGDPEAERQFLDCQASYPKKVAVRIGFDEALAHRIEAGGDLFLMPSRYEPCGLSQLYSLRYGTVPIVRRTGGLADTVVPYSPLTIQDGRATGFRFGPALAEDLLSTILLALRVYENRAEWVRLMQAGMQTDVSWRRSAQEYLGLYGKMVAGRGGRPVERGPLFGEVSLKGRPAGPGYRDDAR